MERVVITHIVLFKMKEFAEGANAKENAEKVKMKLEELPAKIDVIKSFKVGLDVLHSDRSYDLGLLGEYESLEDLGIYAVHPAHLEVVDFIRKVRTESVSLDFEN